MTRATRPDRKKADFWKHQRPRYLLSGLMKCGACGANYTKYGANRFACASTRDRATCNNRVTVRGSDVEQAMLDGLKSRLMEPALFEEFAREFIAEVNKSRSEASSTRSAAQRELERVDRQIKRLVDVILEGGDAQAINAKLKELEAEKARLTNELAISPKEEPLLHPNLATIYRARVDALEALFRDPDHGREAFELLRGLIDEVRIFPEENGEYQLELKGALAGILALAQGAKNSEGAAAQRALQIKMVAGVGFEPTTFRL
jgi:site-specific DNA recombinase